MNKRIWLLSALVLALILLVSLVPTGCAKPAATPAPSPAPVPSPKATTSPAATPSAKATPAPTAGVSKEGWPSTFVYIQMSAAGGGSALGPPLIKDLQVKLGVAGQFVTGGGPAAFVNAVAKGEAHMSSCTNETVWEAWNGVGAFKEQGRVTNLRRLLYAYPGALHFMARAATGIKSVKDWKGRKVMFDWPSNPLQGMVGEALLEANGMTKKDVTWLQMTSGDEVNNSLQTGKIDVGVRLGPPGRHAPTKELATLVDLNFLSFTKEEIKYVTDKLSFAQGPVSYKAGSYKGQDYDVQTVGYAFIAFGNTKLPDSFVYELMKILMDDVGKDTPGHWVQYLADFNWTLNSQMTPMLELPWHEGAVKYFQDRGVWTSWMDAKQKELLAGIK